MEMSLEELIFDILKKAGCPKTIEELSTTIEAHLTEEDRAKITRSTIGSTLTSSGLFIDYNNSWGLTAWEIKDVVFRIHPGIKEMDSGAIRVDHELTFFFPRSRQSHLRLYMKDSRYGEFPCAIQSSSNRIEGLSNWYQETGFVENDDIIIKVVDGVESIYEIRREPQNEKDLSQIALANRRMTDIAYEVFPDDSPTLLSSVMRSILLKMPMKDPNPPDRLLKVLMNDSRFLQDSHYGLFMLSAPKSYLLNTLSDTNRIRNIIDKNRDPNRALRALFGGEPEFINDEEKKMFMEQFMALWNMLKAGPGMPRK